MQTALVLKMLPTIGGLLFVRNPDLVLRFMEWFLFKLIPAPLWIMEPIERAVKNATPSKIKYVLDIFSDDHYRQKEAIRTVLSLEMLLVSFVVMFLALQFGLTLNRAYYTLRNIVACMGDGNNLTADSDRGKYTSLSDIFDALRRGVYRRARKMKLVGGPQKSPSSEKSSAGTKSPPASRPVRTHTRTRTPSDETVSVNNKKNTNN